MSATAATAQIMTPARNRRLGTYECSFQLSSKRTGLLHQCWSDGMRRVQSQFGELCHAPQRISPQTQGDTADELAQRRAARGSCPRGGCNPPEDLLVDRQQF